MWIPTSHYSKTHWVASEIDDDNSADSGETPDLAGLEFDDRMEKATAASTDAAQAERRAKLERELILVDEMLDIAEAKSLRLRSSYR